MYLSSALMGTKFQLISLRKGWFKNELESWNLEIIRQYQKKSIDRNYFLQVYENYDFVVYFANLVSGTDCSIQPYIKYHKLMAYQ